VVGQNATLRQQLVELRQRYTRAKQAMKVAQERLDAHSRKKEELMRQQHKNNDEAIIAQSNSLHLFTKSCALCDICLSIVGEHCRTFYFFVRVVCDLAYVEYHIKLNF